MSNKLRHESMRIAGKKVDAEKTIEVEWSDNPNKRIS